MTFSGRVVRISRFLKVDVAASTRRARFKAGHQRGCRRSIYDHTREDLDENLL